MDYNKFEDRISDWIENSMDIKERKEFEKYLAENPEHKKKVDDVSKPQPTINAIMVSNG